MYAGTASNVVYACLSSAALPAVLVLTPISTLAAALLYPPLVQAMAYAAGLTADPVIDAAVENIASTHAAAPAMFVQHGLVWVLLPAMLGLLVRQLAPKTAAACQPVLLAVACMCIVVTASNKTALNADIINEVGDAGAHTT